MYWPLLIVGAFLTVAYVLVKIRHNQLMTSDAVFWFFFAVVLIVAALFPQLVFSLSDLLGIESPANFVFLCVLVVVVYRLLALSVEMARRRSKLTALAQDTALKDASDISHSAKN